MRAGYYSHELRLPELRRATTDVPGIIWDARLRRSLSTLSPSALGNRVPVAANGSNINQVAINILQLAGPKGGFNQGFYFPVRPLPIIGAVSTELALSFARTDSRKRGSVPGQLRLRDFEQEHAFGTVLHSKDPQVQSFVCLGGHWVPA